MRFFSQSEKILGEFRSAESEGEAIPADAGKSAALHMLAEDCARAESPMSRFEHALAPWIKHLVMPIFALANAGVALGTGAARELVTLISLGVICGLVLGKPIGIVGFSTLAARAGIAEIPGGVRWRQIAGVGMLGGIGFTMSLFITNLAVGPTPALETAKIGILAAGLAGAIVLSKRS